MRELRDNVLRAVSLVVTDRRWAAPLSAMALGFGLFLGVAIGPGAAGGLATGRGQIIALAEPAAEVEAGGGGGEAAEATAAPPAEEPLGGEAETYEASEPEYAPEPYEPEPELEPEEEPTSEPEPEEEAAGESEAQLLQGTVVHANQAAGSYTIATSDGELVSVHAEKLPAAGTRLRVEAEPLANSTFGETERRRTGAATGASFSGVVTHLDPDPAAPTYTVSGRGSSILVHAPAAAESELPQLGAYVSVAARIEKVARGKAEDADPAAAEAEAADPAATEAEEPAEVAACAADAELETPPLPARTIVQRSVEAEPEPATYVDLAAIVSAACPGTGLLLLSTDDLREGEDDLLLTVPKRFGTAKLVPGDSVVATATIEADGTLTLAGLASDEGAEGAEDASSAQGDLKR